jgi:hypothetical protein
MEEVFELVSRLLCFEKNIYLVKSPRDEHPLSTDHSQRDITYSKNFPMLSSTAGARDSTVSDLR